MTHRKQSNILNSQKEETAQSLCLSENTIVWGKHIWWVLYEQLIIKSRKVILQASNTEISLYFFTKK